MKNIDNDIVKITKIVGGNKLFEEILRNILPDGEEPPMKQGKKGLILAVAQDDDGGKSLLTHPEQKVRDLMQARKAVKSWKLHIKRVQNMINQARAWGGKIGVPLNYYGAHTGRWSGCESINLQNLGKRGRAGKGVHPLIRKIRSLLEIK